MREFSSSLLVNILRAAVQAVEQNPEIDQKCCGICEFKKTLEERIALMESREPLAPGIKKPVAASMGLCQPRHTAGQGKSDATHHVR